MNKIFLMGRLTKDPEIRLGKDEKPVARYSIAVDRRYKDQSGNYPTDFFNLTSFGNTATFVEKYLRKGTKIVVEGEIRNNNYEKDGKTVYQDQIVANNVEFAESKNAQSNGGNAPQQAAPQTAPAPAPQQAAPQAADDGFAPVGEGDEPVLPFV